MTEKLIIRPRILNGFTVEIKTAYGKMYVTINESDSKPIEIFIIIGKSGRSIAAKAEAIGRLISMILRNGVEVEKVIKQIKGIGGENPHPDGKETYLSIPDAVGKLLEEFYGEKAQKTNEDKIKKENILLEDKHNEI